MNTFLVYVWYVLWNEETITKKTHGTILGDLSEEDLIKCIILKQQVKYKTEVHLVLSSHE